MSYNDLLEHGFCWSTHPNPTIFDNRSNEYISHNGYIYVMRPLTPSTVYYVRAYAMTKGHAVGYGDVIKIITIPKGTVSYTYNSNGADEGANARINYGAQKALAYWNNLTSIRGLHVTINYSPGTRHRNHRKIKEFIFFIISHLYISYFLHFCHILPIFHH